MGTIIGCYRDKAVTEELWPTFIMQQAAENIQVAHPELQMSQPIFFRELKQFLDLKDDEISRGLKERLEIRSNQYCKSMIIDSVLYFLEGFCLVTGRIEYEGTISDTEIETILRQTIFDYYPEGGKTLLEIMSVQLEDVHNQEKLKHDEFRLIMAYGVFSDIEFTTNGYAILCNCDPVDITDEVIVMVKEKIKGNLGNDIESTMRSIDMSHLYSTETQSESEPESITLDEYLDYAKDFFTNLPLQNQSSPRPIDPLVAEEAEGTQAGLKRKLQPYNNSDTGSADGSQSQTSFFNPLLEGQDGLVNTPPPSPGQPPKRIQSASQDLEGLEESQASQASQASEDSEGSQGSTPLRTLAGQLSHFGVGWR